MAAIKDYQGKSFDVDSLKALAQQLSSIVNPKKLAGGVYKTKNASVGFSAKDLEGALGEKPTVYDQVLMDAARGLLKKGVTDISQLRTENGKIYNGDKLLGRGTSIQIGETFTGEGKTSYSLNLKGGTPSFSTSGSGTGFFDSSLGKAVLMGGAIFGAPALSGALAGATGLTGSALAGTTGAVLGGTTAALTGNDVLTGALTGGVLGYGASELGATNATQGGDVGNADMGAGGGTEAFTGGGIQATPGGGFDLASTTGTPSLSTGGINIADMGGAQGLTVPGATGGVLGAAGLTAATGATAAGVGSGIGLTDAATGAAGSGLLTGNAVTDAALIKGATSVAGGLLQGETTKDALTSDATARANLANEVKNMGKFTPVGITTTFGTSNFVTDPVTGTITPSYTLSPTAKAWQDSLSTLGTGALSSASDIMNLGKQYISESPEAASKNYIDLQKALLAPGREADLAKIRNNLANTGRGGLSFGATSDGMAATNPELAAYYNSLAMADRKLAADADVAARERINFGTGLMSGATKPFTNVFDASKSVETAGQQPLTLSTDFANTAATRGAAQGSNYADAMSPSLTSTYKANTYDPFATFLQGLSDSDLAAWGLSKIKP